MYSKDRSTIIDRRELLRIKLKSLAAEAKIIQHEEKKSWGQYRNEMREHRIKVVRAEARCTHLAYGIIRGMRLGDMESDPMFPPDWDKVAAMVKKYGAKELAMPVLDVRHLKPRPNLNVQKVKGVRVRKTFEEYCEEQEAKEAEEAAKATPPALPSGGEPERRAQRVPTTLSPQAAWPFPTGAASGY